jgi:hypothetical protein
VKLWPQALWARLVLVLTAAGGTLVVLDRAVRAHDERLAAVLPPPPYEPEPIAPVPLPALAGVVRLALRLADVPADAAPVVQVLGGGDFALRRPLPVPQGPLPVRNLSPVVVLPAPLEALDPAARATLADVFGALVEERPIPVQRFLTLDFRMGVRELEQVLGWVR